MYYFSNSTDMSFDDAVATTREALKRHQFAILAEIDLGKGFEKTARGGLPSLRHH